MTGSVSTSPPALKHGVGLLDLVMLGAGTAIGAAIFSVLGPASQVGGTGILIATGLAAIPMIVFALVYAYMASALPKTAASYEWQRLLTKPWIAFAVVWMRILANAVVMIVLGRVLVSYLSMAIDLPAIPDHAGPVHGHLPAEPGGREGRRARPDGHDAAASGGVRGLRRFGRAAPACRICSSRPRPAAGRRSWRPCR
jgi:amino acid transporter